MVRSKVNRSRNQSRNASDTTILGDDSSDSESGNPIQDSRSEILPLGSVRDESIVTGNSYSPIVGSLSLRHGPVITID